MAASALLLVLRLPHLVLDALPNESVCFYYFYSFFWETLTGDGTLLPILFMDFPRFFVCCILVFLKEGVPIPFC